MSSPRQPRRYHGATPAFANGNDVGMEELPTTYKSSFVKFDEARARVAMLGRNRRAYNELIGCDWSRNRRRRRSSKRDGVTSS